MLNNFSGIHETTQCPYCLWGFVFGYCPSNTATGFSGVGSRMVEFFYISPEITAEKLSIGVIVLGVIFIIIGYIKAESLYTVK